MTRKCVTGFMARLSASVVKTSGSLRSTVSLSSGEPECYGMVKAASVGLGMQALVRDWGIDLPVEIESGSSTARASRQGLGRLRHVQTRLLWLQERVRMQHLTLAKAKGDANVADVLTKVTSARRLDEVLKRIRFPLRSSTG